MWGFDLGEEVGYRLLADHFNPRCEPQWSEAELRRKCADAVRPGFDKARGWLLETPLASSSYTPAAAPLAGPRRSIDLSDIVGQAGGPAGGMPPIRPPIVTPAAPAAESKPVVIRNYKVISQENGGTVGKAGCTPQEITAAILTATDNWPKACGDALFVPGPDAKPLWLADSTALFSWLSTHAGQSRGYVEWARGDALPSKPEYFAHLVRHAERYDDVQTHPHYPPRPGVYYMHPALPPGGSGAFDSLLARLSPADECDRAYLRAFFLSLAWGGKLGGRPVFIFEAASDGRPGQGSGKSTAAMLAGKLFGGFVGISLATADDMQIQTRLLSKAGQASRLVVFDNVKGTRVSSSIIESYVTADMISGRQLYTGEGQRPNVITWAITANQPSLSKDFTARTYPIRLIPPTYSPAWSRDVERHVIDHKWQIIADILTELQGPRVADLVGGEWSRWAEWEDDVLCRVCDPRPFAVSLREKRDAMDDDDATASIVRETLAEFLRAKKGVRSAETLFVRFQANILAEAIGKLCPHGNSAVHVSRWARSLTIPGLRHGRSITSRFWEWRGTTAVAEEAADWDDLPI